MAAPQLLGGRRGDGGWSTRLGEQIILEIVRSSHTGTTHRALAERYGISLSSVKRVLRRHRC
jgi:transposase